MALPDPCFKIFFFFFRTYYPLFFESPEFLKTPALYKNLWRASIYTEQTYSTYTYTSVSLLLYLHTNSTKHTYQFESYQFELHPAITRSIGTRCLSEALTYEAPSANPWSQTAMFPVAFIAGLLAVASTVAAAAEEVVFMHTPLMDKYAYDSGEAHMSLMNLMQSAVEEIKSGFEEIIHSADSDEPHPPWDAILLSPISEFVPCVDGYSTFSLNHTYACKNADLYAFVPHWAMGSEDLVGNDIWGWTDPDSGREFGLVAQGDGTAFVEIQQEGSVDYLGRLPTQSVNSVWRDIKVIGNFAYIGSEAVGHGVQVFNLSKVSILMLLFLLTWIFDILVSFWNLG